MPNHVHLLLSTGERPVSKALQALFAGYAGYFNYRYRRSGHLFQNRYKSTLCESERYMRELVRYIHLNPVRAGLVDGIHGLGRYRWSGHRALLGLDKPEWGGSEEVLERYDQVKSRARRKYVAHLREGLGVGGHPLKGESLRRLVEGGWEVLREAVGGKAGHGDERIIGSEAFVERMLKGPAETERWRSRLKRMGPKPDEVLARAAAKAGIKVGDVKGSGKRPAQVLARALACKWLVEDLGMSEVEVARKLGITQPAVSMSIRRGKDAEMRLGLKLEERKL